MLRHDKEAALPLHVNDITDGDMDIKAVCEDGELGKIHRTDIYVIDKILAMQRMLVPVQNQHRYGFTGTCRYFYCKWAPVWDEASKSQVIHYTWEREGNIRSDTIDIMFPPTQTVTCIPDMLIMGKPDQWTPQDINNIQDSTHDGRACWDSTWTVDWTSKESTHDVTECHMTSQHSLGYHSHYSYDDEISSHSSEWCNTVEWLQTEEQRDAETEPLYDKVAAGEWHGVLDRSHGALTLITNQLTDCTEDIAQKAQRADDHDVSDKIIRETMRGYVSRLKTVGASYDTSTGLSPDEYSQLLIAWGDMERRANKHEQRNKVESELEAVWPETEDLLNPETRDVNLKVRVTLDRLINKGIDVRQGGAIRVNVDASVTERPHTFTGIIKGETDGFLLIGVEAKDLYDCGVTNTVSVSEVLAMDPIARAQQVVRSVISTLGEHPIMRAITNRDSPVEVTLDDTEAIRVKKHLDDMMQLNKLMHFFNEGQDKALQEMAKPGITMVLGPGGTGKSACAAATIYSALRTGAKIVVTASSNNACDNIMESILKLQHSMQEAGMITEAWNVYRVNSKTRQWFGEMQPHIRHNSLFEAARRRLMTIRSGPTVDKCARAWQGFVKTGSFKDLIQQHFFESQISKVEHEIIKHEDTRVVVATCSLLSGKILSEFNPEVFIVDEAAAVTELDLAAALKPATREGLRKLIMVGDPCQLPPCVISTAASRMGLSSWFERLWVMHHSGEQCGPQSVHTAQLTTQYRSHPGILTLSNKFVYTPDNPHIPGLKPLDTPEAICLQRTKECKHVAWNMLSGKINQPRDITPIAWINVTEGNETLQEKGFSNKEEVIQTATLAKRLLRVGYAPTDIVVLSPYRRQVTAIDAVFKADKGLADIQRDSIDATQGREYEFVIISMVRTVPGPLTFVRDLQRLTVQLGRARLGVFIVGRKDIICTPPRKDSKHGVSTGHAAWHWLGEHLTSCQQIFSSKQIHTLISITDTTTPETEIKEGHIATVNMNVHEPPSVKTLQLKSDDKWTLLSDTLDPVREFRQKLQRNAVREKRREIIQNDYSDSYRAENERRELMWQRNREWEIERFGSLQKTPATTPGLLTEGSDIPYRESREHDPTSVDMTVVTDEYDITRLDTPNTCHKCSMCKSIWDLHVGTSCHIDDGHISTYEDKIEQHNHHSLSYGNAAFLSYMIHWIHCGQPTHFDMLKLIQRGFTIHQIVAITVCKRWQALSLRGMALCPRALGCIARGNIGGLLTDRQRSQDMKPKEWCYQCHRYTMGQYSKIIVVEGIDVRVCSNECYDIINCHNRKASWIIFSEWCFHNRATPDLHVVYLRWLGTSRSQYTRHYGTYRGRFGHIHPTRHGQTTGKLIPSNPVNTCNMKGEDGRSHGYINNTDKLTANCIFKSWLQARSPAQLFERHGLIHSRLNNYKFTQGCHPITTLSEEGVIEYRNIAERLPFYMGYGVPTILSYNPLHSTCVRITHPDTRDGMNITQCAEAKYRCNGAITGMKNKSKELCRRFLKDAPETEACTIECIESWCRNRHCRHLDSTAWIQPAINLIIESDAIERRHLKPSASIMWQVVRQEWIPRIRSITVTLRAAVLAAMSCNMAYYMGAYSILSPACMIDWEDQSKIPREERNFLRAGPGDTGDPDGHPERPIGERYIEDGCLLLVKCKQNDSGNNQWEIAICTGAKYGNRPIHARLLSTNETWRGALSDVKLISNKIHSKYAQP